LAASVQWLALGQLVIALSALGLWLIFLKGHSR